MHYVLIIILVVWPPASQQKEYPVITIATAEFNNKEACEFAGQTYGGHLLNDFRAADASPGFECVPKGFEALP
jgi:hypothetical protein